MISHTEPVQLRESGGVHIYYALPVQDDDGAPGWGVFEHVSSWPYLNDAQVQITDLETADEQRAQLAARASEAVAAWRTAADSPGDDDEHAAAVRVADALEALLADLRETSLI